MGLGYALYEGRGPLSLGSRGEIPANPPTLDLSNRGELIAFGSESAGPGTNNRAEYLAMLAGLRRALYLGVRRLVVVGDSQLTVRQVSGGWKCRDSELRPLCDLAQQMGTCFEKFTMKFVKRADNSYCDELASRKPAVPEAYTEQSYLDRANAGTDRVLTDKQAALLRWMWEARGLTCCELGRIYGLSAPHAWRIANAERYGHIGEEHL